MAGNANLDTPGIVLRAHHYVKSIDTAHLGHYYSKSLENLKYLVVDCVATPAMDRAPEWTYNNRVFDSIKTHRTLSLTLAGIFTAALLISLVYWLHPKRTPDIGNTTPKIPDKTPETAPPGPDGAPPSGSSTKATGKEPEDIEDPGKDANGAEHEEPLVQDASKTGGSPTKTNDKELKPVKEPAKDANGAAPKDLAPKDKASGKDEEIKKDEDEKTGTSFKKESKEILKKNPISPPSDSSEEEDIFAESDKEKKESGPGKSSSSSAATPPLTTAPGPHSAVTGAGRGAPTSPASRLPIYSSRAFVFPSGGTTSSPDSKKPGAASGPLGNIEEPLISTLSPVKEEVDDGLDWPRTIYEELPLPEGAAPPLLSPDKKGPAASGKAVGAPPTSHKAIPGKGPSATSAPLPPSTKTSETVLEDEMEALLVEMGAESLTPPGAESPVSSLVKAEKTGKKVKED